MTIDPLARFSATSSKLVDDAVARPRADSLRWPARVVLILGISAGLWATIFFLASLLV